MLGFIKIKPYCSKQIEYYQFYLTETWTQVISLQTKEKKNRYPAKYFLGTNCCVIIQCNI